MYRFVAPFLTTFARAVVVWLAVAIAMSAAQVHASAADLSTGVASTAALSAPVLGAPCSPNRRVMGTERQRSCVAEHIRATRGYLREGGCITEGRAVVPNAVYKTGECKGRQTFQPEAVAQARFIAHQNGGLPTVSGDHQWEVAIGSARNRVDYLHYDSSPEGSNSPIELVELKQGIDRDDDPESEAVVQLDGYVDEFPFRGERVVRPMVWNAPYLDSFVIDKDCPAGRPSTKEEHYYSAVSTVPGIVMVTETATVGTCTNPTPTPTPTPTETPSPTDTSSPTPSPSSTPTIPKIPKIKWNELKEEVEEVVEEHPEIPVGVGAVAVGVAAVAVVALLPEAAVAAVVGAAGAVVAAAVMAILATILTPAPANAASGDPHMVSLDKLSFDLQAVGEFTLVEIGDRGIEIQMRTTPLGSTFSLVDRVATEVNGHTVELTDQGPLVDGEPFDLGDGEAAVLGDDAFLVRDGTTYRVHWTFESDVITLEYAPNRVALSVPEGIDTQGLLGDHDGDPTNDYLLRDGSRLPIGASARQVHETFADSWRVTDFGSLFTYDEGESTATYTDRAFPANIVTIGDFPADDIEIAADRCHTAGVDQGPHFDDCVYDILVSGDEDWAAVAAAVQDDVFDPLAKPFTNGRLFEDFTAPVATNFATSRYLTDPATSRVAGPFFDDTAYSFYVTDVGRHDQITMDARLVAYGDVDNDASNQQVRVAADGQPLATLALEGPGSVTATGSSTFVRTGVTSQGEPFRIYDIRVPLQHFGDALKVKLTPVNFRGVIDTAMGVNTVTLQLETAPADDFAVTLPATVAPDQPGAGAGRIETPGAEDGYTFALAETSDVGIFRTSGEGVKVRLVDTGGVRVQASESAGQFWRFKDLTPGEYAVRVRGPGSTSGPATYGLAINTIPADPSADYQVGDPAVTLTTVAAGQNAQVKFTGQQGQRVQMRTSDASYTGGGMRWHVTGPDGGDSLPWPQSLIGSAANELHDTWRLPADGVYTATFDPEGVATGTVRFRAWAVPDDLTVDYALDAPAQLITTAAGQNATVRFQGQAGQRIFMQTSEAAYTGGGMRWQVTAPDGSNSLPWPQSVIGSAANALHEVWTLPVDGTYTVRIDPEGEAAGSVRFRAWTVPAGDVLVPIVLDDPAVTVTTASGQNGTVTFQGRAGQRIQLRTTDAAYVDGGMRWQVVAPDGSNSLPWPQSVIGSAANDLQDTWRLPVDGTYTVTINPDGAASGSVKFRAWTVPDDVERAYSLDDPAITVTTTGAGQNAIVRFYGEAGQRVQMHTSDAAYTEGGMRWHVIAPDGSNSLPWPQSLNGHGANDFQDTWVLPATGTYTVTFDPGAMATGSVTFGAWTVPDDVERAYELDDPATTATTASAGQNAIVRFHGETGQRIQVQTSDAAYTPGGMRWNLQRPDGSFVWDGLGVQWRDASYLSDTLTVNQTGTWRIVIDPQGTATGSVKVSAWDVPPDVQVPLTLGDPATTVTTSTSGQGAVVSFAGVQGQRIQVQTTDAAYTPGGMKWNLQRPDGSFVWDGLGVQWRDANYLSDTLTVNQTGTWRIVIDPQGTATGSVEVRAWESP